MADQPEGTTSYTTLARVSLRMASTLDLDEVLGEITRGLVREYRAALARIWLLDPAGTGLRLVASAGLSSSLRGSRRHVAVGALKVGEIAQTRTAVCTNRLADDPRFVDQAWISDNQLVSFGGYPLVFESELFGVLAIFGRQELDSEAFRTLGVFAAQASVAIKNARLFAEVSTLSQRLAADNEYLERERLQPTVRGIVGRSPPLVAVLHDLDRVSATDATVLVLGETGTGKELFARAVHERSARSQGPLVKVNAAAIAPSLLESELFGHEKGAFTGALARRLGRFELASGGTIFLDEIGELPLEAQSKLLRVLQEREVERVGGRGPVPVDVRVVAATNRDLGAEVAAGRFRQDLLFRLDVFQLRIPPLRARREDIPLLAESFLRGLRDRGTSRVVRIDDDAMLHLQAYDWPGNVRELQNVLERATIVASGDVITLADLPELKAREEPSPRAESVTASVARDASLSLKAQVEHYEKELLRSALDAAGGNQSEAARRLGTSRATLQYKMKIHRL